MARYHEATEFAKWRACEDSLAVSTATLLGAEFAGAMVSFMVINGKSTARISLDRRSWFLKDVEWDSVGGVSGVCQK